MQMRDETWCARERHSGFFTHRLRGAPSRQRSLPAIILACVYLLALSGCGHSIGSSPRATGVSVILDTELLSTIAKQRIFFAHRSVGADIVVGGLQAVYLDFGVAAPRVNDGVPMPSGSFGDRWLNQSDDPQSKLDDFDMWVREKGVGDAADLAFMKLGFVDINTETDVNALFDRYRAMMRALESDYPEVVFLHVTISVTRWVPESNAAIARFNALMRSEYGATGRLFDLAGAISTCTDGRPDTHRTMSRDIYYQICQEYTSDGGHLNEKGAKVAAAAMLRVIGGVLKDEGQ